jgi:hypothetical protein
LPPSQKLSAVPAEEVDEDDPWSLEVLLAIDKSPHPAVGYGSGAEVAVDGVGRVAAVC